MPLASLLAGVFFGAAFIILVRKSARLVIPEDPLGGMVRLLAVNALCMLLAVSVLGILFVYLRAALAPFGIGLMFGFIGTAVVQFVRSSGAVRISD
ncbi:MAG: hypothetical protein JXE06_03445 [Coriobacteriia bacterium]|nr:hypothetical protein [Coriobacteriia bacterium]MBN2823391.1 hypothetical protein [Coriobacteriia bacterium]